MRYYAELPTPVGNITVVSDGASLTMVSLQPACDMDLSDAVPDDTVLSEALSQLRAYFDGRLREFTLPLAPAGTPFQQRVWSALRTIPYASTWSYGQLAHAVGSPGSARAVGAANGRNPLAIVVPCHRVIGADGSLTGYAGGMSRKQWLLAHETRALGAQTSLVLT